MFTGSSLEFALESASKSVLESASTSVLESASKSVPVPGMGTVVLDAGELIGNTVGAAEAVSVANVDTGEGLCVGAKLGNSDDVGNGTTLGTVLGTALRTALGASDGLSKKNDWGPVGATVGAADAKDCGPVGDFVFATADDSVGDAVRTVGIGVVGVGEGAGVGGDVEAGDRLAEEAGVGLDVGLSVEFNVGLNVTATVAVAIAVGSSVGIELGTGVATTVSLAAGLMVGQVCPLHERLSRKTTQSAPVPTGAVRITRLQNWMPPPHETLHASQSGHGPTSQSTGHTLGLHVCSSLRLAHS